MQHQVLKEQADDECVTHLQNGTLSSRRQTGCFGLHSEIGVILDAAWPQAAVVFCRNAVGLTDVAVLGWLGTKVVSFTPTLALL